MEWEELSFLCECLDWANCCVFLFHVFFFFLYVNSNLTWVHCTGDKNHYSCTVYHCSCTIHVLKNIKNGSYGTIYTFKNYFTIILSVFSFQFYSFSKNKLNPNGPYVSIGNTNLAFGLRFWVKFQRLCFPSTSFFFFFFLIENSVFT